MELIGPFAGTLRDALRGLRTKFPGFSTDEADAFELGFWAGAMALAVLAEGEEVPVSEIVDRVEGEFSRIEKNGTD